MSCSDLSPSARTQPCSSHWHQCCAIPPCPLQSLCSSLATNIIAYWPNCSLCSHSSHRGCTLALGRDSSLAQ